MPSHRHVVQYRADFDSCAHVNTRTGSYQYENKNLTYHAVQHDGAQVIQVYVYEWLERALVVEHTCLCLHESTHKVNYSLIYFLYQMNMVKYKIV